MSSRPIDMYHPVEIKIVGAAGVRSVRVHGQAVAPGNVIIPIRVNSQQAGINHEVTPQAAEARPERRGSVQGPAPMEVDVAQPASPSVASQRDQREAKPIPVPTTPITIDSAGSSSNLSTPARTAISASPAPELDLNQEAAAAAMEEQAPPIKYTYQSLPDVVVPSSPTGSQSVVDDSESVWGGIYGTTTSPPRATRETRQRLSAGTRWSREEDKLLVESWEKSRCVSLDKDEFAAIEDSLNGRSHGACQARLKQWRVAGIIEEVTEGDVTRRVFHGFDKRT